MTEKLLSFLFVGILLTLGYQLGIGEIYGRFFPASRAFTVYWYIPLVLIPALLLALLAWVMGFYRPGGRRGPDLLVTMVLAAIVTLTVPTSYSCGSGCF